MSSDEHPRLRANFDSASLNHRLPKSHALLRSVAWLGLICCAVAPLSAAIVSDSLQPVATQAEASLKQRQIAFLNRIRKADPDRRTIQRAVFNEQNELGLILSGSAEMDKIPALMRSLLTQMTRVFPGQDLTILAYAPSNPPRKIGTARLNARTRDMTYTPEH